MGETYVSQNFWIREAMLRGAKIQDDGRVHLRIICDGTLYFGDHAASVLRNAGCKDLTTETTTTGPQPGLPPWMTCIFDVSGTHPAWPDEMPENRWEESPMCQYLHHEFKDLIERERGEKWWARAKETAENNALRSVWEEKPK